MKRVLPLVAVLPLLGCSPPEADPPQAAGVQADAVARLDEPTDAASPADPAGSVAEPPGRGEEDGAAPDSVSGADAPDATRPGGSGAGDDGDAGGSRDRTDPYAVLDRASEAYEALRSIQADFRQEARNPLLRRTVRSSGTLFQRQPDLFLMRFDDPPGDVIVSDGEHLWVYYPSVDSAQVVRLPAARGAGATDLRSQFIGEPRERFNATSRGTESVDGRPADVLMLEPKGGTEAYGSLLVWIDRADGLARRFEITEGNGLVRRFDLSALRKNPDLSPGLFRFDPPDGVRIVDRG